MTKLMDHNAHPFHLNYPKHFVYVWRGCGNIVIWVCGKKQLWLLAGANQQVHTTSNDTIEVMDVEEHGGRWIHCFNNQQQGRTSLNNCNCTWVSFVDHKSVTHNLGRNFRNWFHKFDGGNGMMMDLATHSHLTSTACECSQSTWLALLYSVGTLKDGYFRKVPLPQFPRGQSTVPAASAATSARYHSGWSRLPIRPCPQAQFMESLNH